MTRPDREAELDELVEVAHGAVDEQPRDAPHLGLRREQLPDERDRSRRGAREDQDVTGARVRDGGVHHRVVAGLAERRPRRPRDTRPRHDADQVELDDARASRGLVDGRHPEPCDRGVVRHSASTTTGSSRWNASA